MAVFSTILLITAFSVTMGTSIANAVKSNNERKCNIENMNKLVDQYKKINEQFEQDIQAEEGIDKIINNLKKLEDQQVKDLTDKLMNSQKDYQKRITNIYTIFGIFTIVIVIACIIKAVLAFKFKHNMKMKYLSSLK